MALNSTVLAATNFDVNGDGKERLAYSKNMTFNLIPAGTFTMGSGLQLISA